MRKKLQSKQIIVINAAVVLLFIVVLVGLNLFYFNRLNNTLSSINEIHNRKLEIITQMSHIVRDRSLLMLNMHLSDDIWYIDEQFMRFRSLAPRFIELREQLQQLPLADNEQDELRRCLELINKTAPLQNDIAQRIYEGGDAQVLSDIMSEDMPLENRLWEGFNRLQNLVTDNAARARESASQDFRRSLQTIIIVAALLALLTTLLMLYSLRRIQRIETRLIDKAELLSWEATHDPLTNLWNRRFLEHHINQLLDSEQPAVPQHVLLYIDLDDFKPINDTYGHDVGDAFLRAVSQCAETCIRKNDTLARIGGDEFAVLLENCTTEKAGTIAECIRGSIGNCRVEHNGTIITNAGCSVGIAAFSDTIEDFQHLLRRADHACYTAKHSGKNQIRYAVDH